jgi:hypothetical protein
MKKTVAIIQSNYIPWKGYFDIINSVEEFILYDEVQYTKNDWRNRNRIIGSNGSFWLTIPVHFSNHLHRSIASIAVTDSKWNLKHRKSIQLCYARALHYKSIYPMLENIYDACAEMNFLSEINQYFIEEISRILGIQTKISLSTDYGIDASLNKTEKLVALCLSSGATQYLSGPSAGCYLEESLFAEAGIKVDFMNYDGYPEYRQLSSPFEHQVSIIDLLLNEGFNARNYMKSFL